MYGLVGVAMHAVVGVLVVASFAVLPGLWSAVLAGIWLLGGAAGAFLWRRTVWVPLLASLATSTLWMIAFFTSR
jgi:hypothetical protein